MYVKYYTNVCIIIIIYNTRSSKEHFEESKVIADSIRIKRVQGFCLMREASTSMAPWTRLPGDDLMISCLRMVARYHPFLYPCPVAICHVLSNFLHLISLHGFSIWFSPCLHFDVFPVSLRGNRPAFWNGRTKILRALGWNFTCKEKKQTPGKQWRHHVSLLMSPLWRKIFWLLHHSEAKITPFDEKWW